MMRRGLVGTALLAIALSAANGAEQEPWQRMLQGEDAKQAAALQKQIDTLGADGKFADALKTAEKLLALRQRVQGDKHWETVSAHALCKTLKDIAAQPISRQRDIVTAYKRMDEAYQLYQRGRYSDAESLYRQILALLRETLGEQHAATAQVLNSLAEILREQSKYAEARTLLHQALAIYRRDLGEPHPTTALVLNNLALNLASQGKYTEAEKMHRQTLAIRRTAMGPQHPHVAHSLSNLAESINAQGKYAEAEPLYRQALTVLRTLLGEQHPSTAISFNNLATNLHTQGKYAEAELLFRQVLALIRKVRGEAHPHTATGLNNLAINLHAQSRYAEAEAYNRQALSIYRTMLGEQHPSTALSLNNVAFALDAQGRHTDAEPLLRQSLAIFRHDLGEQHPRTIKSLSNVAHNLYAQRRYADAEQLDRQTLSVRRKTLGEQHPETITSLYNLTTDLGAQGKYGEAEALYRQALATCRKALGEQHTLTAISLAGLAFNLGAQGKHAEAEMLFRQALAIQRKVLGEQHSQTAQGFNNLAFNLHAQGKLAEAENLWRSAADTSEVARFHAATSGFDRAVFASQHADPNLALAGCLARLGQPVNAWHFAEAGLGRGLLDDLTIQNQLLPAEEQNALPTRLVRIEQLNRLLLPLLTAEKLKDAESGRRDQLVKERNELQAEVARQAAERSRREVWSLERIQKQLPTDAALVFWIDVKAAPKAADPNGEHWGCVVRQRGEPTWVRLPGSGEKDAWTPSDDQLPRRFRDDLASGETGWQQLARQLTRQRLAPLLSYLKAREDLPAIRRLIAVPAGAMAGIPLEVLSNDYIISYAPSGTVFARLQKQHRPLDQPSLLALGDPNFNLPKDKPSPLPEHGLLLTLVLSGGNASKAGLRDGDVLLSYNNHPLHALADLKPISSGASVPVQVWRDGKTFETKLPPGQLGVSIDRQPAADALRRQRNFDALLASRNRDQIASLPASRYEVRALEPLFAKASVLLGSDASEQKLDELASADRLKDYRVLHLATHGEVNLSSALQSCLLLARDRLPDVSEQARKGGKIYDGRLRAATMAASWRLDADLVTLSACQTALGPSGGGDGLLGFSQVLFRKGARSLLLSLWKVDDTATALLMTRFYENWLGRRKELKASLSKSESLREAKQWLRNLRRAERDRLASRLVSGELRGTVVAAKPVTETPKEAADMPYAHPRYWAAFILIGDPE